VARAYFERKMVFEVDEEAGDGGGHGVSREWSVNTDALRKKSIK